jgi:hypothetical protein
MPKDERRPDQDKQEGAAGLGTAQPSAAGAPEAMGKVPGEGAGTKTSDPTRPVNPGAPIGDKIKPD